MARGLLKRVSRTLWNRGATEATLLVTAAAVASGVLFGAGVARATSQTSDGQTWVSGGDGTIVQINPVTGEPVAKVETGVTGTVALQQSGGVVLVSSASGRTVSINVGQMVASQPRTEDPGTHKWLLAKGRVYVADLQTGVIRSVDPATNINVGESFVAPGKLADVVVDNAGTVWALTETGSLTAAHFSDEAHRFITDDQSSVDNVRPGAKMIPHGKGVTVISPETKSLVQVGTDRDVASVVPALSGTVLPADTSPQNLTAATVSDSKSVVILDDTTIRVADVGAAGCDEPGKPAVFGDLVYVPCLGQGRTMILDRTGASAREDIRTGDGEDPMITRDDDALVVTSAKADTIVTVDSDGRLHRTEVKAKAIPVRKPKKAIGPPTAPGPAQSSPAPTTPSQEQSEPDPSTSQQSSSEEPPASQQPEQQTEQDQPTPSEEPDRPTTPSSLKQEFVTPSVLSSVAITRSSVTKTHGNGLGNANGSNAAVDGPRDVVATVTGPGTVQVWWNAPRKRPQSYLVQTTTGAGVTQVGGQQTSAVITTTDSGSVQFVVIADFGAVGKVRSAPSNAVDLAGAGAGNTAGNNPAASNTPASNTAASNTPASNTAASNTAKASLTGSSGTRALATGSGTGGSVTPPVSSVTPPPASTPPPPVSTPPPPVSTPPPPVSTPPPPVSTPPPPVSTPPPPASTPPPPPASTPPITYETPVSSLPPSDTVPATEPVAPVTPVIDLSDSIDNKVVATWQVQPGEAYSVTFQLNSGTPSAPTTLGSGMASRTYGIYASGVVTVRLTATLNGMAASTQATWQLTPTDPCNPLHDGGWQQQAMPICQSTPTCQTDVYYCAVPLQDGGWLQAAPATDAAVNPMQTPLGRYGSAAALVALAGLIRWRRRSTGAHLVHGDDDHRDDDVLGVDEPSGAGPHR